MKIIKIQILIVAVFLLLGCVGTKNPAHRDSPRDKINNTVHAVLVLIEKKDSQSILKNFVYLKEQTATMFRNGELGEIPTDKLKNLKVVLERVLLLEPEFSENGTIAFYTSEVFPEPIRFIYMDNQWKIFE